MQAAGNFQTGQMQVCNASFLLMLHQKRTAELSRQATTHEKSINFKFLNKEMDYIMANKTEQEHFNMLLCQSLASAT